MGIAAFTEDVDLLVTREGLEQIHQALEGLGYVRTVLGSKALRDTNAGVKIDFLIAGQFPGDGKTQTREFSRSTLWAPNLGKCGAHFNLPALVELKLASGMTGAVVGKIWATRRTIKFFQLPAQFAEQIESLVRATYLELWKEAEQANTLGDGHRLNSISRKRLSDLFHSHVSPLLNSAPGCQRVWLSLGDLFVHSLFVAGAVDAAEDANRFGEFRVPHPAEQIARLGSCIFSSWNKRSSSSMPLPNSTTSNCIPFRRMPLLRFLPKISGLPCSSSTTVSALVSRSVAYFKCAVVEHVAF